ncbi:MAG: sugar-binding protein [Ignavibacteria bacterium]
MILKKYFLRLLVLLFVICSAALNAQVTIDNFDTSAKDNLYKIYKEGKSTMVIADDASTKAEGAASLNVKARIDSVHVYGSYVILAHDVEAGKYLDISSSDALSIWIKVNKAPAHPENLVLRIQLGYQPSAGDNREEYTYENSAILDAVSGWVELKIPLTERVQSGTDAPDATGFILAPNDWKFVSNNRVMDRDKIVGYNISITTTSGAKDSVDINLDSFTRSGSRKIPFIVFNGKIFGGEMSTSAWGGVNAQPLSIVPGAGSSTGKSAVKWVVDPQPGTGGAGWAASFPAKDMSGNFRLNDIMKLKVKIPAGFNDDLRVQFASPSAAPGADNKGTSKYVFTQAGNNWDGTWKTLSFPLNSGIPDGASVGFDPAQVNKFEIMGDKGTSAPCEIYFDDIWAGSPVIDVIAPVAVTDFTVTGLTDLFYNVITWTAVPNETGARYDIYYSLKPITSLTQPDIEVLTTGIPGTIQSANHLLRAPADQDLSLYYAITCTDSFGNVSPLSTTGPVANKAKSVPIISLKVPEVFTADGNLTEWTASGIKPFVIKPSELTVAPNTKIENDADLSVLAYLAIDNTNLYVAFDVTDDIVNAAPEVNVLTYQRDSPELYLGLYDFHGAYHQTYARGATPDYHFRFNKDTVIIDGGGINQSLVATGSDYIFKEKLSGGYTIEAKIPLQDIATKRDAGFTGLSDNLFVPVNGMRIPVDFAINDNDNGINREGILCYSPANESKSWEDVSRWLYTWVGTKYSVGSTIVSITSPIGGENWQTGSSHNITWSGSNVTNVKIEYSTDNGAGWATIITNTPAGAGSYGWTVPNLPSVQCRVKVSDAGNASLNSVSTNTFTISAIPILSITTTAPLTGAGWTAGSQLDKQQCQRERKY